MTGRMPAVVLAAGQGQRLAPLTNKRPKPMLPVANRPLLEYVLAAIAEAGIEEAIFVVGYRQERIRNHFEDGDDWGVELTYVEQSNQLGTGHAILQVEPVVDGSFLVLNGDRIIEPRLIEEVSEHSDPPALSVTRASFPSTFGVIEETNGRLAGIEEKPIDPSPTASINAGVYKFDERIFNAIRATDPVDGELQITATLDRDAGEVELVRYDGTWLDVTFLWDLLPVNEDRIQEVGHVAKDIWTVGETSLAPDVAIDGGVHIGPGAAVCGGTAIGENARVGPHTVLLRSVIFEDAMIRSGAVLHETIVGANATVGPNVTVGGGPAQLSVEGRVHDDVALGAVVGDNADVGAGAVLAPGTIIGEDATVEAGARVSGVVPTGGEVRRG